MRFGALCLQSVGDVARQAAGRQQYKVEALLVRVIAGAMREPQVGGPADARGLLGRHRPFRVLAREPALDLDKREALSPQRDDVDLADARLHTAPEDHVAL